MPGSTVPLGFPYPLAADPTAGPADIQALAEAVDVSVAATMLLADDASSPPAIRITGGPQPILNNSATNLRFDTVVYDNTATADLISNPSGVNIPVNGQYVIVGNVAFAANVTGLRSLAILQNLIMISRTRIPASPDAAFPTAQAAQTLRGLVTTDLMRLQVLQNSGVTLNVTSCALSFWRVGP